MPLIPPAVKIPLPPAEGVREFFVDLLGRAASVDRAPAVKAEREAIAEGEPMAAAVYTDKRGNVAAVLLTEVGLAAAAGAALVLAPATAADEARRAGTLPGSLRENFQEVANIFVTVLNTATTPHLRLDGVSMLDEDLPEQVWDLLAQPGNRRDWNLTIEGYATGHLALFAR